MYTKFYGLTKVPFETTPDPDFLFLSEKHKEVLASLIYGVQSGKGFVLVVGDVGTGKTTLINTLLKKLDDRYLVLHLTNPKSDYAQILEHLAKKMSFDHVKKSNIELAEYVRRGLIKVHKSGKRLVLIIDEAHLLSKDSLEDIRLLSNIATAEHHLIQIVLAGQVELYHKLKSESLRQLRQRIVINRTLDPLDEEETLAYISHRLRLAGRQSPLFTKSALKLIWKTSQGIPRVINHICDNSLLIGFAIQAQSIGKKIVREVIDDMKRGPKLSKSLRSPIFRRLLWLVPLGAAALLVTYLSVNGVVGTIFNEAEPSRQSETRTTESLALKGEPLAPAGAQSDSPSSQEPALQEQAVISANEDGNPGSDVAIALNEVEPSADKRSETEGIEATALQGEALVAAKAQSDSLSSQDLTVQEQASVLRAEDDKTTVLVEPLHSIAEGDEYKADYPLEHHLVKFDSTIDGGRSDPGDWRASVSPKDYLCKLAEQQYGTANDTTIDFIHMANPQVWNVNRIYPGQKITLPHIQKKDLVVKDENGKYFIHYASFYNFEKARTIVDRLIMEKQRVFVIPASQGYHTVYRIYFGIFNSRQDAERKLDSIELEFLPFVKQ